MSETGEIRIRPAEARDRDFILGLVPELIAFGPPPWRLRAEMISTDLSVIGRALSDPGASAAILVAESSDGARLGFIHLCEEHDYYSGRIAGHIADVVVAPESRRLGAGRALMAAAEAWARDQGFQFLTLNVFVQNGNARALYSELGFHEETIRCVKPLS